MLQDCLLQHAGSPPIEFDLSCRMCSSDGVWLVMRRVMLAGPCAAAGSAAVRCLWTVNTACKAIETTGIAMLRRLCMRSCRQRCCALLVDREHCLQGNRNNRHSFVEAPVYALLLAVLLCVACGQ
jgi:hypothetical protein